MRQSPHNIGAESFAQTFPMIMDLSITVAWQSPGFPPHGVSCEPRTYSMAAPLPPVIPCLNPRCRDGGIDLHRPLLSLPSGTGNVAHSGRCEGHEGVLRDGRPGPRCYLVFEVTGSARVAE
jgi:hypothetical protein